MCGIAGFEGRFDPTLLDEMGQSIAHRGPDDDGISYDRIPGIGLTHRRLSIIDLSPAGHQPMISDDGRVAIIFNGEIYNFRELRSELEGQGYRFRGGSDTEVLLALYLIGGEEKMLTRLNGIFAFAIWDSRSQTLFLARDGMGVKPLYYAETAAGFLFASEIKALLKAPQISRNVDPTAIRHYLTYLWCPAPRTPLRQIKKLEPGCALLVRDGQIKRHWRFYALPVHQPMQMLSERHAIEQTRVTLRTAVQRQMVADVPLGAFLSGGLDSSAVVAFARQTSPGKTLQCFTIAQDRADAGREGITDDLPYAESVARYLGVDLHTIRVGPEMADDLVNMIYHLDEPQADPASLNVLFISRLARQHGIKVLLSGVGGDDIFSGYRRHRALTMERYWSWMPNPVRTSLSKTARFLPAAPPAVRRLSKAFMYAGLEDNPRIASYFRWLDPHRVSELLTPAFRTGSQNEDPLTISLSELPDELPLLDRMLYLEGKHFLPDHNLNYTDKMSMAAGVEVRVPLLDRDLVALAATLPVRYKQRGGENKWVFKKAMEGLLPREVIYRPKTGFGVPLRSWLHGPLSKMINDVLSEESLQKRGWFNAAAVNRLVEASTAGRVDGAYSLFAVLCVELWARSFLDN